MDVRGWLNSWEVEAPGQLQTMDMWEWQAEDKITQETEN